MNLCYEAAARSGAFLLLDILLRRAAHSLMSNDAPQQHQMHICAVAAFCDNLCLIEVVCTSVWLSSSPFYSRVLCPAGELFPTEVRTTAHGFSAGVAKLGALWATIFFNYIGNKPRFWCAANDWP